MNTRKNSRSEKRCYICKRENHIIKNCKLRDLYDVLKKKIKKKHKIDSKRNKREREYAVEFDFKNSHIQFDDIEFVDTDDDEVLVNEKENVSQENNIINID